jgi:GDP-4-dehydro-6-deoxy-D-mannose reductase
MRTLITGASGFAGSYLAQACHGAGERVLGVSRSGEIPPGSGEGRPVDLLDADAVREALREFRPQVVYHLAALSSVGRSWEDPARTMHENVTSSLNLLEALRAQAPRARVVWVSSCEVYGVPEQLPITENSPVNPANPYAVSKAAGDMLAALYVDAHGLDIIRARPFSHAGPGQRSIFLLSSVARQAAEARLRGEDRVQISTGNPQTRRDFTDVRDIVRAYRLLAERARPGIYNVSSGQPVSAAEQVALLAEVVSPMVVEHVVDPARVRAHEVMDLHGSHERVTAATAWEPQIPLRQTMADTVAWWEQELTRADAIDAVRH